MIEVIPAILTNSPQELKKFISQVEGVVKRVQIDIIDGRFAKNRTIEPSILKNIDTNLLLDFQLMTKEPVNWVEKCLDGTADRVIGHIEMMQDQVEFVGRVQEVGLSVGLGLDLETPVSELDPVVLNNLDVVLVMSVPAGFGGQKFDKKVIKKIRELDEIRARDDTPFKICVDGGITKEVIASLMKAGADEVSIGRRLFKGNLEENIERFKKATYK